MKRYIIDIETRGNLTPDMEAALLDECSAPANYKDPVKINTYIQEQFESKKKMAATSPLTGRVACVGLTDFDSGGLCHQWTDVEHEGVILGEFVDFWNCGREPKLLIGFNIRDFDIPFLNFRIAAWRHLTLREPFPFGRWSKQVFDLRDTLPGHTGTLNALLLALGIEDKGASGADSLLMSAEELAAYNKRELAAMHEAAKRFERLLPTPREVASV